MVDIPVKKLMTLCIIRDEKGKRVLLGMKKRGFGAGRYNGFGGKVAPGEDIATAALRETNEEASIVVAPVDLKKSGVITFTFEDEPRVLEVHIFEASRFTGVPRETEEMKPEWFAEVAIPYDRMWSDDHYWLPILLSSKKFVGTFLFDKPSTAEYSARILKHDLREVETL
jgi:8-oxo-dGTP pyrophosphatase MutT (NUDIX family)